MKPEDEGAVTISKVCWISSNACGEKLGLNRSFQTVWGLCGFEVRSHVNWNISPATCSFVAQGLCFSLQLPCMWNCGSCRTYLRLCKHGISGEGC